MYFDKTYLLLTSLLLLLFSGCSDSDSEPAPVVISSISLTPTSLTLAVGESADISATVKPDNATDKSVSWESSNFSVATVSESGLVTAMAPGTAIITASAGNCRAECKVTVNSVPWIDAEFAKVLQQRGYIKDAATVTPSEVENITDINVSGGALISLKGIEYFSSLQILNCWSNNLISLDLSKNTQLKYLDCWNNQLETLDVSKNTQLRTLYCPGNQLTTLDVSKNIQLINLNFRDNQLTALDVSKNMQLTELVCFNNQLISLDISKNTLLANFSCFGNPGSNGQFRVKAWFDNNSVPSEITSYSNYKSSWTYYGATVTIYYYK